MSQAALIVALLALLALGVGAIALLAFVNARNLEGDGRRGFARAEIEVDEAMELHRQHMFLKRHPEWEGRDFRGDRSSPWYTDPEFSDRGRVTRNSRVGSA